VQPPAQNLVVKNQGQKSTFHLIKEGQKNTSTHGSLLVDEDEEAAEAWLMPI
jgi:hypothetical protein